MTDIMVLLVPLLLQEVAELERVNRDYVKLVTDLKSERSKLLNLMENHDLLASLDDHSSFSCPGDFNIDASTMTQLNTDVTIDRNDCTLESQIALDILWPVP
jgi:hypothetical protein